MKEWKTSEEKNEEYPLRSVVCFISKALNKLDKWNLRNVREVIIKNSIYSYYITVDLNTHIYLLLLYVFFHLGHVNIMYYIVKKIN